MPPKRPSRTPKTAKAAKKTAKKTAKSRNESAPRATRGAPATVDPNPRLVDGEDDVDGEADEEGDSSGDAGDDDAAPPIAVRPRDAAAGRIGHSIYAHLEALHMTDPDGAIEAISTIVPVSSELAQIGVDLEVLGAADLARDVRLAVDRMQRTQRTPP